MGNTKYFESVSADGNVTQIDDNYKTMQLMETIIGQAVYKYTNDENYYYVNVGGTNAKDLIWGYGLDELDGYGKIGLQIDVVDESTLGIRLITEAKKMDYNNTWSTRDDAIMNKIIFYGFKNINDEPKSNSLCGFEVYKKDGTILYTTKRKILKIIFVTTSNNLGSLEDNKSNIFTFSSPTITYSKTGVLIPTGARFAIHRNVMSDIYVTGVDVTNKSTKVQRCNITCTSRHRRPTKYANMFFWTIGGIFAEI